MKRVLYINACVSTHTPSRTKVLAEAVLQKKFSGWDIEEICLSRLDLQPFTESMLQQRNEYIEMNDFSSPLFQQAHALVQADAVVIAAPYWDLSFPSLLKVWIEHCMVTNLTFRYTETGVAGLCRASRLIYVTTAGGYISEPDWAYGYIRSIAAMIGIRETCRIDAQGLDIQGNDALAILTAAIKNIK